MTDLDLLRQYAGRRDSRAFEVLVRRHLDWVYSCALRQVGDAHMADDVTQAVFLALSQQAGKLGGGVALGAWLFRVTQKASAMAIRSHSRRRKHERLAAVMTPETQVEMDQQTWQTLAPVLDELVGKLGETDRQSILLRYYQRKSFAEMSAALAIDEAAARKRTSRAVEKLRNLLESKGVSITGALLVGGLGAFVTQPAPASSAAGIAALVAAPSAASPAVLSIMQGALSIMSWSNIKFFGAAAAVLIAAAIGISIAVAQSRGDGKALGGEVAAAKPAPVKPATTTAATQAAKGGAPRTPKGVVEAAYRAAVGGDEQGIIDCFTATTADEQKVLRMVVRVMSAIERLRKAVAGEFGENVAQQFDAMATGVRAADVAAAPETISGDKAVVELATGPGALPLVKVGETWKVSAAALKTLNVQAVAQWGSKAAAIRKLAEDVEAGKFLNPGELQKAMAGLMK